MEKAIPAEITAALLSWYRENRRALPWRETREPYRIWISEIMLQQTRVEAVRGYYARFLEALPTVEALAGCGDEKLFKLWEGLGYYSRVRNLRKAAQVILERHGGVFPGDYSQVLALPGIGPYTAGAICSIAFGQPTPAVDGNVLRLYARLMDDDTPIDSPAQREKVTRALAAIYPEEAGDFTQALMELGATVCGPNHKPDCPVCPCRVYCLGYARGTAESLPVKQPKKEKRREELTVFILRCGGRYALERRPEKGLLAGLWQFPNAPGLLTTAQALETAGKLGLRPAELRREVLRSHVFTHVRWEMKGIYLETAWEHPGYRWFAPEELESQAALPTAFRQFWEEERRCAPESAKE